MRRRSRRSRARKGRRSASRRLGWASFFLALLLLVIVLGLSCRRERPPLGQSAPSVAGETGSAPGQVEDKPAPKTVEPEESGRPVIERPPCLFGCPDSDRAPQGRLMDREGWVLFNDPKTKFADWVAYRVSPSTIGKSKPRDWKADPDLPPEETLEPEDFRGAHAKLHTDRGHQVPLASFSGVSDYEPLNYMSNVTPQRSLLNQRLWNVLEQEERRLVLEESVPLFVVTGPLFERDMEELPGADEEHAVPSGYFKVIVLEREGKRESGALIVEQGDGKDSFCAHEVSIDEVERRAKMDLFRLLPDEHEREFEKRRGTLFLRFGCGE